jgi:hypothetical protein
MRWRFIRNIIVFLLLCVGLTFLLSYLVPEYIPASAVYDYRVKYNIFKNNPDSIGAVLTEIKERVKKQNLKDYVIILGDSVGFGTPVSEKDSVVNQLNSLASSNGYSTRFFNLSIPSEYPGDTYVLLKKMEAYGISTDHIMIDLSYFEFFDPGKSKGVFWFKQQLYDVDSKAADKIFGDSKPSFSVLKDRITHGMVTGIPLLIYKDYMRSYLSEKLAGKNITDYVGDIRPWYEKKDLPQILNSQGNRWYSSDTPFVMNESNSVVFFLNKIIEAQKGKDTLMFLTGMNRALLPAQTSKPGFNSNIAKIDAFFKNKSVKYVDYDRKIDYKLYADHIHLTPEGYKLLAEDLWSRVKGNLH